MKKILLSIVIPSRGNLTNIKNILTSLEAQTFKDFNMFLVIDKHFTQESFNQFQEEIKKYNLSIYSQLHLIANVTSTFNPQKSEGGSYIRNFGMLVADGEFTQLFDDDVVFDKHFLEQSFNTWQALRAKIKKDFVLTPTLMYRQTGRIQNQGFKKYNFAQSRPIVNFLGNKQYDRVQMYSGNSLLAPAYIFKQTKFDEQIAWIGEDLDFTYRIHESGYPIYVFRDLKVFHMERNKTILEQARVGNKECAYQKSKNRILFAKKHANMFQKIIFYMYSLWGNSVWLLAKIRMHAPWKQKFGLTWSFLKGIRDGIRIKVNK